LFVWRAWWKLYGFPRDPRLYIAFFVHDLGYLFRPNMDGKEGEWHPMLGSNIMARLFDWPYSRWSQPIAEFCDRHWGVDPQGMNWGSFALYHSRYLAKAIGHPVSKLCFADKLATARTPSWLYLPMVTATGEIREYLKNAQTADSHWKPTGYDKKRWHAQLCDYMHKWVEEHKDGRADEWTNANRHSRDSSGVWH
jgi:hypothetical protein